MDRSHVSLDLCGLSKGSVALAHPAAPAQIPMSSLELPASLTGSVRILMVNNIKTTIPDIIWLRLKPS